MLWVARVNIWVSDALPCFFYLISPNIVAPTYDRVRIFSQCEHGLARGEYKYQRGGSLQKDNAMKVVSKFQRKLTKELEVVREMW